LKAIILASGRGSRFHPLTTLLPKPLLPVANRPLLEYLITALTKAGCSHIFVTVGYEAKQIQRFLANLPSSASLVPIFAPEWSKGPFHSLKAVIPRLSPQEPFLLVPADLYVSAQTLTPLMSTQSELALLFDAERKLPGTQIEVRASNQIYAITQNASALPKYSPVIPALRATSAFLQWGLGTESTLPETGPAASTVADLLSRWLLQEGSLQGIPITAQAWCDVDEPHQLVHLNHYLLSPGWPPAPMPLGTYLPEGTSMAGPLESATLSLGHDTHLRGPVLLGTRVRVGNKCLIHEGTTLGASTVVQDNSELAHCITFPGTQVPLNVHLVGAILDATGNIIHSR
jgi:NDP-sugar pyrophosphorylase family protein